MEERTAVERNGKFIVSCAWKFVKEKNLVPAMWLEDVIQESYIAFITFLRKVKRGELPCGEDNHAFAEKAIWYHLHRKFVDFKGMHVTHQSMKSAPPPTVYSYDAPSGTFPSCFAPRAPRGEDWEYVVYFRDWLRSLPPQDRRMVELLLSGYKTGEVINELNIPASQYYYRRNMIRSSYSKYFDEAS